MPFSKFYSEIREVYMESKKMILNEAINYSSIGGITEERANDIIKESFKNVSNKFAIDESTVRDKCTRQLNCTIDYFYKLVVDYMSHKNNDFEDKVIGYAKSFDNIANIRADLESIR